LSRIRCDLGAALILLLLAGPVLPASLPPIVAKFTLEHLAHGAVKNASPVFLSEDTLALLVRSVDHAASPPAPSGTAPTPRRSGTSKLAVLRLANEQLQILAETDSAYEANQLFSVSNGRLLIAGAREKTLYSPDLRQKWELGMKVLSKQFPQTGIIGEAKGEELFRLTTPPTSIDRATGELLAVSSDMLVYQTEDAIRTTTADGAERGSIQITPGTRYFNNVEIAGPARLYFSLAGDEHITDLAGKMIVRVQPPGGWGFRDGWSSDGKRLLFDRYLRNVGFGRRLVELIADALGPPLLEEANGEVVRVIDVSTGATCLNLESPHALLGQAGEYHADLSPSGSLVAIATSTELTVYHLPTICPNE